jgi:hypothetical protein
MDKIRVITLKKDVPEGTTSYKGFHLLDMGKEGIWLVDQDHPGYTRCVQKAIQLANARKDKKLSAQYAELPISTSKPVKLMPLDPQENGIGRPKKEESEKPKAGRKKSSK